MTNPWAIKVVAVAEVASASNQATEIARLTSILAEVTGASKDASVQAVSAAVQAVGDGATVAQVVARLDTDAATQTAILAELEVQGVDLGTVVSTLAAIGGDVDGLETIGAATQAAVESIDTKTLPPLGATFVRARGSATVTASQLPSSSTPRGFALENIDASADLWVGVDNTVTSSNGFRISPSRSRFYDLPNPSAIWVISVSTTAWQIGAVA